MLADLRRTLAGRYGSRYGTGDERAFDARRHAGPPGGRQDRRLAGRVTVPVSAHVIAAGPRGRLSRHDLEQQIATLNDAYGGRRGGADTGVVFRLATFEVTSNGRWFDAPQRHERAIKAALRRGGPGRLNLYTAAVGADVLGFSTFPQWYRKRPWNDGVMIDHRSIPGGPYRHFDRGYTAVHEVGHWLGLFHTFENGCVGPGDGVADTPYEEQPTEGCPWFKDTCAAPGGDPVHNFMDYGWDDCMREFTAGQGRRIHAAWAAYRSAAPSGARDVGGAR